MYETSDIRKGLKIKMDGDPWMVVDFQFVKPGKGNAFTRTRLKNLKTGQVLEKTFKSGEKLESAVFEERHCIYLYSDGANYVFMDKNDYEQLPIPSDVVGESANFLLENTECILLFYEGRAMGVELPTFIDAVVVRTEPGVRGDTVTGATKPAVIATGAQIAVPLFVNEGDTIRIDTRDGSYVERIKR
jgi:elongation factor P